MNTARRLVVKRAGWLTALVSVVLFLAPMEPAQGHEARPAYLELRELDAARFAVLWKVPGRGPDERLSLQPRFPEGTDLPTPPQVRFTGEAFVDRFMIQRSGGLDGETIAIDGLANTLTDVLVRIERLDGSTQVTRLTPAATSFEVAATPGAGQVMTTYLVLGVEHILLGIDHLLFVLALLLIVKGWRKLVGTITAFTVAHSLTLGAASLGWVHVPGPPVEAIIALSIVFVAMEVIHTRAGRPGLTAAQPWIVAFSFGLLHGFGFAGALEEIGLPQNAIPLSLLFFNLGVELGQLVFVAAVLGIIGVARRLKVRVPESLTWLPPYAIGGIAMFWVIERVAGF